MDRPSEAQEFQPRESGYETSHAESGDLASKNTPHRPPLTHHVTSPTYQSPLRHHLRHASTQRQVKETLNARSSYKDSQDDGRAQHHINQYIVGDEIGRGSFGAVHLAVDQYGQEYAVKEFSKARLRKRAASHFLRQPRDIRRLPGHLAAGTGLNAPLHHAPADRGQGDEPPNSLHLIKEEIAIMKKLNHNNLVSLIEVLDDPDEDSLYMVLEMCKKGVIMKVGLNEQADPYAPEDCRLWFRDMILGIEYLHAQGVIHRDIKPDNLLLTADNVLKIVDFGVSEMFEKESDMRTAKSAGSPAFLPPELCVVRHGDVSGPAADIWSMGVSLYCLMFGRIPFEREGVMDMYEAIRTQEVDYTGNDDPKFLDLMHRILEKDPTKRITMDKIREHPWVTNDGADPLLPKEINTAHLLEPPTELEMNHAITHNIGELIVVVKAVNKFKLLLAKKYPERKEALFGDMSRFVQPPEQIERSDSQRRAQSLDLKYRNPLRDSPSGSISAHDGASENVTKNIPTKETVDTSTATKTPDAESEVPRSESPKRQLEDSSEDSKPKRRTGSQESDNSASSGERGHAHDPLEDEPLWLGIGTGESDLLSPPEDEIVAESPGAVDFNIYETAYQQEVERIRKAQGDGALVYLTRRVDSNKFSKEDENMVEAPKDEDVVGGPQRGLKDALESARRGEQQSPMVTVKTTLSGVAEQVGSDIRNKGNTALASTLHKMTFGGGEEDKVKQQEQQRLKEMNA